MAKKKKRKAPQAPPEPPPKIGRPLTPVNKPDFERLCYLQCTMREFAAFFQTSIDTIYRFCLREYGKTFAEVFEEKRAFGFIDLRRAQFHNATKRGSTRLQVFLGKQYLGQTEKVEINHIDASSDANNNEDLLKIAADLIASVQSRNIR